MVKKEIFTSLILAAAILAIPFLPVFAVDGIVPCGGPGQPECNICWFFVLARAAIDFLIFKVATAMAAVALVIAGFLFLTTGSDPGRYEYAKTVVTSVFKGYLIMLAGWLFINVFFMAFGVTEWSGLKEGWWKVKASCAANKEVALTCGDGQVTGDETCDPKETLASCQSRTGYTTVQCQNLLDRCGGESCRLEPVEPDDDDDVVPPPDDDDTPACDESDAKVGQGCYLDENGDGKIGDNECKKGKFVCDEATKKLKCEGDGKIYDYCCSDNLSELADGKIGDKPFTIIRATVDDIHMTGGATLAMTWGPSAIDLDKNPYGGIKGGFNCDEVCKKAGKVCVGIGLTDPSKDACVYEVHDESAASSGEPYECIPSAGNPIVISAQLSANQARNNCKAWFGFVYYSRNNQRWSTAYDKYTIFCYFFDPRSARIIPAIGTFIETMKPPDNSCGKCKPKAAPGEKCTGTDYKQDPSDSCAFHGNDLGETACYCY